LNSQIYKKISNFALPFFEDKIPDFAGQKQRKFVFIPTEQAGNHNIANTVADDEIIILQATKTIQKQMNNNIFS
jgi:hypothetical protein